jgi:hypothetical protein
MHGQTPDAVYTQCFNKARRTASAELLDLLCLRRVGPLKVHQNGVTWQGIRYGQYDLARHLNREVILRIDERDISRVQVYSTDDKLIAIVLSNEKMGWTAGQELKEAIASKKQDGKLHREYVDRRPRLADDLPDRIVRAKAAKAAAIKSEISNPDPPQPNICPIRHPLEDQLPAIQRAVEQGQFRQAVGSDSTPLPSKFIYRQEASSEEHSTPGLSFSQLMAGREPSPGEEF